MSWIIEFDKRAQRDLAKLDPHTQREIASYLDDRIAPSVDPKSFGHGLLHDRSGVWRFRVRDYRILCRIETDRLVVLVIQIGHRSNIYDR